MAWNSIEAITPKERWRFTPPLVGEYFRLSHLNSPFNPTYWICQAEQKANGEYALYNIQKIRGHASIILYLPPPPVFERRAIGIKAEFESERWSIEIEASDYVAPAIETAEAMSKWIFKNSDYAAQAKERIVVDLSTPFTLTLPANPVALDEIELFAVSKSSNALSLNLNNKLFSGAPQAKIIFNNFNLIKLVYLNDINGWIGSETVDLKLPYDRVVTASQPIECWRLEETFGTVAANAVSANNGSYNDVVFGATGLVSGSNKAIAFKGTTTSFVNFSHGITTNTDYTAECVFSLDSTSLNGVLVSVGTAGGIAIAIGDGRPWNPGNKIVIYVLARGFVTPNLALGTGKHHLAVVVKQVQSQILVYLDGQLIETANQGSQIPDNRGFIGGYSNGSENYPLRAIIDEVAIYKKELTAQECLSHFQAI